MEYIYYMKENNKQDIPRAGLIDSDFYDQHTNVGFIDCFGVLTYDHEISLQDMHKYKLFADEWNYKHLFDYYSISDIDFTDDDKIIIDGKTYDHELNLSPYIPDSVCSRVLIDGEYYYF